MRASHFLFGRKMDGFIPKILEDGFNGTVDITWGVESLMKIKDK
jgi:hypothetical protein